MARMLERARALMSGTRGTRGETITEVLAAIVIGGLAILLLATAISSAVNMNIRSREAMDRYYVANNSIAEVAAASGATGTVTISGSDFSETHDVGYAVNDQADGTPIVSYELEE